MNKPRRSDVAQLYPLLRQSYIIIVIRVSKHFNSEQELNKQIYIGASKEAVLALEGEVHKIERSVNEI